MELSLIFSAALSKPKYQPDTSEDLPTTCRLIAGSFKHTFPKLLFDRENISRGYPVTLSPCLPLRLELGSTADNDGSNNHLPCCLEIQSPASSPGGLEEFRRHQ